jgi:hypothetical protein
MQRYRDKDYTVGEAVDEACKILLERKKREMGVDDFPKTAQRMKPGVRATRREKRK